MQNGRIFLGLLLALLWGCAQAAPITAPVPLTQTSYDHAPQWSPDGQYIAFLRSDGVPPTAPLRAFAPGVSVNTALWVRKADGTELRCLVPSERPATRPNEAPAIFPGAREGHATEVVEFAWAPDSRALLYVTQSYLPANFHVTTRRSGPVVVTLEGVSTRLSYHDAYAAPAWSPDGRQIAWVSPGGYLYVVDREGKAEKELADHIEVDPVVWTPDGQRIICRRLTNAWVADLCAVTVASGEIQNLTNTPDQHEVAFALSHDGATLAYTLGMPSPYSGAIRLGARDGVYVTALKEFQPRKISAELAKGVRWLPDGQAVQVLLFAPFYTERERAMHILPQKESVPQVLLLDTTGGQLLRTAIERPALFSFAPDSRQYVYAASARIWKSRLPDDNADW